jgi:hypothetical protein
MDHTQPKSQKRVQGRHKPNHRSLIPTEASPAPHAALHPTLSTWHLFKGPHSHPQMQPKLLSVTSLPSFLSEKAVVSHRLLLRLPTALVCETL